MEILNNEIERLKNHFDAVDSVRETAYLSARDLRRLSVQMVRDLQRNKPVDYVQVLAECKTLALTLSGSEYKFGFMEEALQEYSEAALTYAFLHNLPAPTQEELGCTERTYLMGLADAISELRRGVLNLLREDDLDTATRLFDLMDRLFHGIMVFDHTDAVLPLRRKQDALRAVLERTRADLTTIICQKRLENKLKG